MTVRPDDLSLVTPGGVTFSHRDIANVVDDFYTRVQNDERLSVPFQSVHDWPAHIEHLIHFWWIRFGGEVYMDAQYNPVMKHFHSGFNATLLARWLELFHETLRAHLSEEQCNLWTTVTERMGNSLSLRNEHLKQQALNRGS
ncbi:MAG: group III truncated hemoglobin [Bdellovibrionales bacterium]|nr:group III truncated hemoglobin [Bdellovibrionales bacterium]